MENTTKKSINLKEIKAQAEKIHKMRESGLNDYQIKEFLELEVSPIMITAEYEKYQTYKTVDEALEIINDGLKKQLKKKMQKHKLLELLREGEEKGGIEGFKGSNKTGYLVDSASIQRYIEREKMTKEDLFKALEEANKRIAELEQELAAAKSKPKRTAPKQNADKAK